jgi:hypothetical protein
MARRSIGWWAASAIVLAGCSSSTVGSTGGSGGQAGATGTGGSVVGGSGGSLVGGSGGTSAGGGAAGAAGAVGTGGGPACGSCTLPTLHWGSNGGMVVYQDTSALDACAFSYTRVTFMVPDAGTTTCSSPLPPCGQTQLVDQSTVAQALANPDVVAALGVAPVLYGMDERPTDGTVQEIDVGGRIIDVGSPCGGTAGCTDVPAGVTLLLETLGSMTTHQLTVPDCAGRFTG